MKGKQWIALLLAAGMLTAGAACGKENKEKEENNEQQPVEQVVPTLEDNRFSDWDVKKIEYFENLFTGTAVTVTDEVVIGTVLAQFNGVTFEAVSEEDKVAVMTEVGEGLFFLLGKGTVMIGESGRAMLTQDEVVYASEQGAVSYAEIAAYMATIAP